jgi:hypothetical protein
MKIAKQLTVKLKSSDNFNNYIDIDYYNTSLDYRLRKTLIIDKRFNLLEEIVNRLNYYADNKVDFSNTNIIIKERYNVRNSINSN